MSHMLQKAQSRLDNISKVKPILAALRTISLGSWQMARNRRGGLQRYAERLLALLPAVLPAVVAQRRPAAPRWWPWARAATPETAGERTTVVLVIGSERGLIGQYNARLVAQLEAYLDERAAAAPAASDETPAEAPAAPTVTLMALGTRLIRELRAAGYTPAWTRGLSLTSLPPFALAEELIAQWLAAYEAYEVDGVVVMYNADQGAGTYAPALVHLLPPELPPEALGTAPEAGEAGTPAERWQPPEIVVTDPVRLYVTIVKQWTALAMYRLLLEAAVTEHAARYQLMESATQNADRLTEELTLMVQTARRQAITKQMQELAVGAGLLGDNGPSSS